MRSECFNLTMEIVWCASRVRLFIVGLGVDLGHKEACDWFARTAMGMFSFRQVQSPSAVLGNIVVLDCPEECRRRQKVKDSIV